jgi:hypothetical protein
MIDPGKTFKPVDALAEIDAILFTRLSWSSSEKLLPTIL